MTENANDTSNLWSALKKLLPKNKDVSIQEMAFGESSYSDNERTVTYNAANLFNCLCSTIKCAKSVTTFKNLYWCDMEQYTFKLF